MSTTSTPPSLENISNAIGQNIAYYIDKLDTVPGGQIIRRYVRSSYKNDPVRSLFELALVIFAVHYFLSSKRKENKGESLKLKKEEVDDLVNEWEPEPLVNSITEDEVWDLKSIPVITGQNGSHVEMDGKKVVNLASYDFLGLNSNTNMNEAARSTISSVGVGACGPPNFYGTQDVHVRLEEHLAQFLGTEQSIIYGQDLVTAGSVIPAFLKRGDLVVCDSGVSLAIQKAVIVSRCNIQWFDHNDADHLESLLSELDKQLEKEPLRRRFIVTEGIFANTGDICPLPKIVELKNKFKYRLILDETFSVGVVGKTGRGVPEHFGIPRSEISITIGSFANAFASSGGWCAGVKPMISHQRINSIAYVFSAALPPYCARVSSQAMNEIDIKDSEGKSKLVSTLSSRAYLAHSLLKKVPGLSLISDPHSPIAHLVLPSKYRKQLELPAFYGNTVTLETGKQARDLNPFNRFYNVETFLLQKIVDGVLAQSGFLLTRSRIVLEQENLPVGPPQLQFIVNANISEEEIINAVESLKDVSAHIFSTFKTSKDWIALEQELKSY